MDVRKCGWIVVNKRATYARRWVEVARNQQLVKSFSNILNNGDVKGQQSYLPIAAK